MDLSGPSGPGPTTSTGDGASVARSHGGDRPQASAGPHDDPFGSTVTLASRICDAADAGRILASDLVRDLGVERGFAFDDGRELVLKGFSSPILAFELAPRKH